MKKVLIVIDLQNDFITGSLGSKAAVKIIDGCMEKIKQYINDGNKVFFTKDTHYSNYLETFEGKKLPVNHCILGTHGWEFPDQILDLINSNFLNVLEKNTFGSLDLIDELRNIDDEIEFELIGLVTDICVISNALLIRANFPNSRIIVDSKLCAGTSIENHRAALEVMKSCQIEVINQKTILSKENLSMLMDLYEPTMSMSYFEHNANKRVAFDVFYRRNPDKGGFSVFLGLEHIIDYILNLRFEEDDIDYLREIGIKNENFLDYLRNFKFTGDVYSLKEGTVMYPNTPIMTVVAPIIEAQLIETFILNQINHQSLIGTKARRIVKAANGRKCVDFGARRAHNVDSANIGARAAYICGFAQTATLSAGKEFNIPVTGTMAHSYIMFFENEYEAFKKYAQTYPDSASFLVDTYDVLKSGIPNVIRVFKEVLEPLGKRVKSIRLDSGDLAYLSKESRKMLDAAGMNDCKIVISNSLDEYEIASLINQGSQIDVLGVGERLITARSESVFGAVYKIVDVEGDPRIKISETLEKITNPGLKDLYRVYDSNNKAVADLITLKGEVIDPLLPFEYVDQTKPFMKLYFKDVSYKKLQEKIIENGNLIYTLPKIDEIRDYVSYQFENEIWEEEQRFENPHIHYVDMSKKLFDLKTKLIEDHIGGRNE